MLGERERRANRRHAGVIEDYEAARDREFRRIIAPILHRAEAVWTTINDERLRTPDGFESFVSNAEDIRTDPSLVAEFRAYIEPVRAGLAHFDRDHRPDVQPFDTPRKLVAHIVEKLDWIGKRRPELLSYIETGRMVLESKGWKHRTGHDPDYPGDEARALYRAARGRALAFAP